MGTHRTALTPEKRQGSRWDMPTWMYIIARRETPSSASEILYIGISSQPGNRLKQHMKKPWFPTNGQGEITMYGPWDREEALINEGIFINEFQPPHNSHPGYWLCEDGRFTTFGSPHMDGQHP